MPPPFSTGLCSAHQTYDAGCRVCNGIIGPLTEKQMTIIKYVIAIAEEAGFTFCKYQNNTWNNALVFRPPLGAKPRRVLFHHRIYGDKIYIFKVEKLKHCTKTTTLDEVDVHDPKCSDKILQYLNECINDMRSM